MRLMTWRAVCMSPYHGGVQLARRRWAGPHQISRGGSTGSVLEVSISNYQDGIG